MNDKFLWGTATSSYQIEGAANQGGRSPSIWDTFSRIPGAVHNGDTGDTACDHYNRYNEDLDLMKWLGVDAYRMSFSWSRILPDGTGRINNEGIDFYDRVIDGLLERNIDPWVTLYHWDLPQVLQDKGGWNNRDITSWFSEYANIVSQKFGDRVKNWMTLNEPLCSAWIGHLYGDMAPGIKDLQIALNVSHHLLLSHGLATHVIKSNTQEAKVGIVLNVSPTLPATESDADIRASRVVDGFDNRWFLDPIFGKGYPQDVIEQIGLEPLIRAGDLAEIATPIDFLGINFYFRQIISADPTNKIFGSKVEKISGVVRTAMGWEVNPQSFYEILMRIHQDYAPKQIYITENGSAWSDLFVNEKIEDLSRIKYFEGHLDAMQRARTEGAQIDGYFAWSLLDNFEWAYGYQKRFGIVHVDFDTQKRTPKASAHWFRDHIAKSR